MRKRSWLLPLRAVPVPPFVGIFGIHSRETRTTTELVFQFAIRTCDNASNFFAPRHHVDDDVDVGKALPDRTVSAT